MTRYVLDSTFLIDHLRDDPTTLERMLAMNLVGDALIVCDVSAAEVWSGRRSEHPAVETMLQYLEFVQPGPPTSRLAGIWRAEARQRGRHLALPDALIAATAFHLDAIVLTRNIRDFELTPARVEVY